MAGYIGIAGFAAFGTRRVVAGGAAAAGVASLARPAP
jgi:hypothetical protein